MDGRHGTQTKTHSAETTQPGSRAPWWRRSLSIAWYTALAILIVHPFQQPGYLLLLDWTPAPGELLGRPEGPFALHDIPLFVLLGGLDALVPNWLTQRIILSAAIAGAGLAAHVTAPARDVVARLFAGTLYAVNGFVFVRLLAGHWTLLLAYALAPLAVRAILALAHAPTGRRAAVAGLWMAGLALVSVHFLVLLLVVFLAAAGAALVTKKERRRVAGGFGLAGLVIMAGTAWWLLPAALQGASAGARAEDVGVFASTSVSGASLPVTLISLRGFWIPRFNPTAPGTWPLLGIAVLALALAGMAVAVRDRRRRAAVTMLTASIVVFLLALGLATPLTAPLARALYSGVPGSVVLREPHKGLALLALAYAWFGAVSVQWLRSRRLPAVRLGALALLALPFISMPQILVGLNGRLHAVEYPASWHTAEVALRRDPDRFSVLILPWRLYLPLPWNDPGEPVANPAARFFSRPVLVSDDPEIGPGTTADDPVSRRVESLIAAHDTVRRFGAAVAPFGIKYVLLVPGQDPKAYGFLFRQEDLATALSSSDLVMFRNEAWQKGAKAT